MCRKLQRWKKNPTKKPIYNNVYFIYCSLLFTPYLECAWWDLDMESLPGLLLHDDLEGDSSVSNTKWFQTCINNIHVLSAVMEWWIALNVIDSPTRGSGWNTLYCPWIPDTGPASPTALFPHRSEALQPHVNARSWLGHQEGHTDRAHSPHGVLCLYLPPV